MSKNIDFDNDRPFDDKKEIEDMLDSITEMVEWIGENHSILVRDPGDEDRIIGVNFEVGLNRMLQSFEAQNLLILQLATEFEHGSELVKKTGVRLAQLSHNMLSAAKNWKKKVKPDKAKANKETQRMYAERAVEARKKKVMKKRLERMEMPEASDLN